MISNPASKKIKINDAKSTQRRVGETRERERERERETEGLKNYEPDTVKVL